MNRAPAAPSPSADAHALRRVADGDIGAMGALYERHAKALLRFATRIVGSIDAEDIVQSAFVRAAKVAATYDDRSANARPWLLGISARLIQERRRSLARLGRAIVRLGAGHKTVVAVPKIEARDIDRGLSELTEAKRTVIVLAEIEGFACDEIARMLGVPIGTVWTRLHHARRELRHYLGEEP